MVEIWHIKYIKYIMFLTGSGNKIDKFKQKQIGDRTLTLEERIKDS